MGGLIIIGIIIYALSIWYSYKYLAYYADKLNLQLGIRELIPILFPINNTYGMILYFMDKNKRK